MNNLKNCFRCEMPKRIWANHSGNRYCRTCYIIAFPKNVLKGEKAARAVKKKDKQESVSELKKKLDKVFSEYIRRRNADENGMVKCFTSGKVMHWKEAHAGHFISRRHMGTRFDEINVQVQSVGENLFNQGNAPVFGKNIIEHFGIDAYEMLFVKMNAKCKYGKFELKMLIQEYTEKVKQLENKL